MSWVELRLARLAEGDRDEEMAVGSLPPRPTIGNAEPHRWVVALVDQRGLIEVVERGWAWSATEAAADGVKRFAIYDEERR